MIIGYERNEDEIGAVCRWKTAGNPGEVLLQVVAIAGRHRGGDGAHAREAISTVMSRVIDDANAAGSTEIYVEAKIHQQNGPSKLMCSEFGFKMIGLEGDLERWAYRQDIVNP
jgi:hypothetical protein